MRELPTPPLSRASSLSATADTESQEQSSDLPETLDALLEQYLTLLDKYTTLRTDLSQSLSTAHFNLAHAQRNASSSLGVGRRYGFDCYDQRMKAHRRLNLTGDRELKVVKVIPSHADHPESVPELQQATNPGHRQSQDENIDVTGTEARLTTESSKVKSGRNPKVDPGDRDPVSWFGVLVPPVLRKTQTSFVEVLDLVPALVRTNEDMTVVEKRIWKVREEMGILKDYDYVPTT